MRSSSSLGPESQNCHVLSELLMNSGYLLGGVVGGTTHGLSLPASGLSDAIIVHVKVSYLPFFTVRRLVLNMALYQSHIPLRGTF